MTNGCKWVKDYIEEYDAENWENMSGATTLEKHNNAKMEAAIELVYSTTVGANDENGKFKYEYSQFALTILSSGSTNTLLTEMQADEKSKIIDNTAGDNLVRSISGITTSKVDTFAGEKLDGEYDMLSIKIKTSTPRRSGTLPLRWLPCIIIRTQARETKGNGTSKIISASAITIPIL